MKIKNKMKKFLIIGLILFTMKSSGQNTFPSSGNVGIGTTSPQFSLDIQNGNIRTSNSLYPGNLNVVSDNTSGVYWHFGEGVNTSYAIHRTSGSWSGDYQQLRLGWATGIILDPGSQFGKSYVDIQGGGLRITSGNVGIGTTSPGQKLEVSGGIKINGNSGESIGLQAWDGVGNMLFQLKRGGTSGNDAELVGWDGITFSTNHTAGNVKMRMDVNGNVGIGTTSPTEKLSVDGNIKTKKLIVTQNGWSDYVFNDGYHLRPLTQVANFIKENKHLPDVPTAKDVEKNGVDVGATQALLLKKIEELTLYMIEQDKRIEKLEKENQKLKNK